MTRQAFTAPAALRTAQSSGVDEDKPFDEGDITYPVESRGEGGGTGRALGELFKAVGRDLSTFLGWILRGLLAAPLALAAGIRRMAANRSGAVALSTETYVDNDRPADADPDPVRVRTPQRRRGLRLALVALLLLVAGVAGVMVWALHDVPFDRIASGRLDGQIIALTASDGAPLIQSGPYQEVAATRDAFPDHLVNAVLAIEDRRFYEHWGLDVFGIARALSRNMFAGEIREGGSTITQQLLKILYLEPDRTIRRKVQELFLSLWLENRLSKDEILTLYLNNVYLGAGATGMPAAARIYFDKDVSELSVAESAMLAGLIASPSALNPLENLEGARNRAALVLQAMRDAGMLDQDTALEAQLNSARLSPQSPDLGTGTWFADWAMQQAQETAGQFRGSVKATTTLDPVLQTIAEQSVRIVMDEQGAAVGASQAAMVVLGPDGAVLAMVGGRDYAESQFNRALAMRQPGSTFKLFTYYAALKMGATPDMALEDSPIEIDGWSPENFNGEFYGRVSMSEALARSLNVATVRLGMDVGLPNIVAAARELGIDAPLTETPSLILGASEVSLLDMTGAYASIRQGVAPVQPYGISTFEAPNGRPFTIAPDMSKAQSLGAAQAPMLSMLQLAVERGTGQAARLDHAAAGKTGTSQDYRDAWFIGFDENYTVGVWVGNDDNSPMDGVTGGQLPTLVWHRFMTDAVPPMSATPAEMSLPAAPVPPQNVGTGGNSLLTLLGGAPPQCNIQACSSSYRSFRASDCTYQPYSGPRRMCEK